MAADAAAFWIDYDYDRENASDGISRYGAYVRQSTSLAECWDGTWDDRAGPAGAVRRGGVVDRHHARSWPPAMSAVTRG